jgi:hypothetical protein
MTNERERDAAGEVSHVPATERAKGPGSTYINGALSYTNPEGSRFSDGSFGVYYTAHDQQTAIAESSHHRELFMKYTKEPPMWLAMRLLTATLTGRLHDIRGMARQLPGVYSPTSYSTSQELGVRLRGDGSFGVAYDSVRHKGGQCAAVLRAPALSRCQVAGNLIYEWDGAKIVRVLAISEQKRL